jgi:hypothetical protein
MNTINLSQFDLVSASFSPSISTTIPNQLSINLPSMNILKLNGIDITMDKIAMQAMQKLMDKYKATTLVIKAPTPTPKPSK